MELKLKFPFEIRGKLSTTPEQAKRMFGFSMKKDATGILIFKKMENYFIKNLMPNPFKMTRSQKRRILKFNTLTKLSKEIKPIISKKYGTLLQKRKIMLRP